MARRWKIPRLRGWLGCALLGWAVGFCQMAPVPQGDRPAPERTAPTAGAVFVLSGPSGTGKSTVAKQLVREVAGLAAGVSHTTRAPRPGEVEGVDYCFVTPSAFDQILARDGFVEWVAAYGHRYGLSREGLRAQRAPARMCSWS